MSKRKSSDGPFFVGYAPVPRGLSLIMFLVVALLIGGAVALGLVIAGEQDEPGTGQWLSAEPRTYEGVLRLVPYPVLFYTEDGVEKAASLMGTGKVGVLTRVAGLENQRVRIEGFHVEREGTVAIEFVDGPDAITAFGTSGVAPLLPRPMGTRTVQGEIIDSKCFLGVMKPGEGKAHKACATLCLIGGVPPHFVVQHPDGFSSAIITGPNGEPLPDSLLRYVADPVRATGIVERLGPLVRFRVDPDSVARL